MLEAFHLKAKSRIWPWQSYTCRIRSIPGNISHVSKRCLTRVDCWAHNLYGVPLFSAGNRRLNALISLSVSLSLARVLFLSLSMSRDSSEPPCVTGNISRVSQLYFLHRMALGKGLPYGPRVGRVLMSEVPL